MKIHPSYLRTPELHISIFIRQQQLQSGSLTESAESEALINISHKVYIDRSLAFSRDNHVVDL